MTDTQSYQGKTYNFIQLLQKTKVEIPIIQRDYAQGRKDKQELRDNFLTALYESISQDNPIKLDFIYGSNVEDTFQPLDGQQRLTTLFLLHWYAAAKENLLNGYIQNDLKKFSYETRISSREFCKALVENSPQISPNQSLSTLIIDSPWFFLSWKSDPTIDAMLRTCDDIHRKFYLLDNLWQKLTEKNLISFYHVELENIGLTDDLYIKMNARGKLLSPYENFKASFEKLISDSKWEDGKNEHQTFAFAIDTSWTDFLWKSYRKNNSVDDAFMRFIATIAMVRQSLERKEDRISVITKLQENPNNLRPHFFSKDSFEYLQSTFETYRNLESTDIDLDLNFPLWRHRPKKDFFSEIVFEDNVFNLTANASYSQKVLFFAQTEYLLRVTDFNKSMFDDWMRVVRNIVSRGSIERGGQRPDIIRSPQTFDGVINLINELSEGCQNIYEHLANTQRLNSAFARDQVDEEKIKAKLILQDFKNKDIIFKTEDNDLLMGRIAFAFYCIGFKDNLQAFDVEKLDKVQTVINSYFQKEADISNDLRRALLTIEVNGAYEYYGYWRSFWNVVSANKYCLLDNFRELEYYIDTPHKDYFRSLILKLTTTSLQDIVKNFSPPASMPNWKKRLIAESALLDQKSRSNYIAIADNNKSCYLLRSKRPRDIQGCVEIS